MKKTNSAGGVVINDEGKVLITNQNGDSWSLPKGHIDEDEDALIAAKREIREETGLSDIKLIGPLGTYERFKIGKGGVGEDKSELKHIEMFLFRTDQKELRPIDPANPEAKWEEPGKVAELLTHHKDSEFYKSIYPEVIKFLP